MRLALLPSLLPVCLLTSLLLPAASRGQEIDPATVDGLARAALKTWDVPGASVAIVYQGKVVYLRGFGDRQRGKDGKVTPDTVFPLASCTKAFTTTALAMLADEGKLRWDDPVRKQVPSFHLADPHADALVTLRDLVCHRTGVAGHDFLWYRAPWSQEESIRRLGKVQPSGPFRASFHYQSIAFMAAGRAVESASGRGWDRFVQRRIFEPLGMKTASTTTTAARKRPDHASPHRKISPGKVETIAWYEMDRPNPAGSINASARDLSKWLLFQLGDGTFPGEDGRMRLLSAAALEETHKPHTIMPLEGITRAINPCAVQMSYGLGWVVHDYRGHLAVAHGGAIDGFRAYLMLVPDAQLGVAVLCNLQGTDMCLALSNAIVDHALGLSRKDWNAILGEVSRRHEEAKRAAAKKRADERRPDTKPSRPLADYCGTYEDEAYGVARISREKDQLVWRWSSFCFPMEHYQEDSFVVLSDVDLLGQPLLTFEVGRDGVQALRVLGREFKRK